MRVFVDTSAFAAIYNAHDQHFAKAKNIWQRFPKENPTLFTSNYVISETIILLRVRAGFSLAECFGNDIFSSAAIRIIRTNEPHEKEAWSLFKKYSDHDFSFVDCCSFAIMKDLRISTAFSFDHHFQRIGFDILQ